MNALAKAKQSMLEAQGLIQKEPTLEETILAREIPPPLTKEEVAGKQAADVAGGDWGPVFIYGQMLSQVAWCSLIGRMPEMRPCWLRGYERRAINRSTFAGIIKVVEEDGSVDPDCLTVGQAVSGLKPFERRLLDSIVDDGFQLMDAICQPLDDLSENLLCTTYVWRQDKYPDAVLKQDWDQDGFNANYEAEFVLLCADAMESYQTSKMSDEELKEKALRRRREMTGFEDEEEFKPEEEEQDQQEEEEGEENEDDASPTSATSPMSPTSPTSP